MRMTKKLACLIPALSALLFCACADQAQNSGTLGMEAYREGDYARAEALFAQAITQNQTDGSGYVSLGMSRIALGLYDEAAEDFTAALKLDGTRFYALRGLGIASLEKGDYDTACGCFEEALSLKEAKGKTLKWDITAYLAEAESARGNTKKALELYEGLAGAGYQAKKIYILMGDICADTGDAEAALGWYQKSLDLDSGDYGSFFHMSDKLKENGADELQRVVLEAALQIPAKNAKSLCGRGRCLLGLDREQEAFAAFEEAYNGGSAEAGLFLGYCYEQRDNAEEAIRIYQELVRKNPDSPEPYNALVRCYTENGQYENAMTMAEKGLALATGSQERETQKRLLFNRGICLERAGRRQEALAAFLEFTRTFPEDEAGRRELLFLRSRK